MFSRYVGEHPRNGLVGTIARIRGRTHSQRETRIPSRSRMERDAYIVDDITGVTCRLECDRVKLGGAKRHRPRSCPHLWFLGLEAHSGEGYPGGSGTNVAGVRDQTIIALDHAVRDLNPHLVCHIVLQGKVDQ